MGSVVNITNPGDRMIVNKHSLSVPNLTENNCFSAYFGLAMNSVRLYRIITSEKKRLKLIDRRKKCKKLKNGGCQRVVIFLLDFRI